jgi:hypothetical protein
VIGWTAVVLSALLVPMAPPRAEPLDVVAVDASGFPRITLDIVAPVRHTADPVTTRAVDVDGAPVESVTPIDPNDVVIGLVVDDRPGLAPAAVARLQGAAVELVRDAPDGVQVSLGTPSGLRTALTPDRAANIARVAGVTAGSPAVVELSQVLVDTVSELGSSPAVDRHAVVVIGGGLDAGDDQLVELAAALAASGTMLHVVAPASVEPGAIARTARASGGDVSSAPEVLAAVDVVTARILDRFRVVTTVSEPGRHRVRVSLGGQRFAANFTVPEPVAGSVPSTTVAGERVEPVAPVATVAEGDTPSPPPRSVPQADAGGLPPRSTPQASEGGLPLRSILYGVLGLAVVGSLWAGILVLRRRRDDEPKEKVAVKSPPARVEQPVERPAPPSPPPVEEPDPPARTPVAASRVVRAARPATWAEAQAPRRVLRTTDDRPVGPAPDRGRG